MWSSRESQEENCGPILVGIPKLRVCVIIIIIMLKNKICFRNYAYVWITRAKTALTQKSHWILPFLKLDVTKWIMRPLDHGLALQAEHHDKNSFQNRFSVSRMRDFYKRYYLIFFLSSKLGIGKIGTDNNFD